MYALFFNIEKLNKAMAQCCVACYGFTCRLPPSMQKTQAKLMGKVKQAFNVGFTIFGSVRNTAELAAEAVLAGKQHCVLTNQRLNHTTYRK